MDDTGHQGEQRQPRRAGGRTFEFALSHPREYQLRSAGLLSRTNGPQPHFEFVIKRCVEWLGVSPRNAFHLVLALWSVVHGTALLFIMKAVPKGNESELRSVLIATLGYWFATKRHCRRSLEGLDSVDGLIATMPK